MHRALEPRRVGLTGESHLLLDPDPDRPERYLVRFNIITDEPELLRSVIDERAGRSDVELLLLALSARLKG